MLQVFLTEDPETEYLFCGAPSRSKTSLLFRNDLFCLWLESVYDYFHHGLTRTADKAYYSLCSSGIAASCLSLGV